MERFKALGECIPFILAAGQTVHLSIARIIEAVLIAAATGAFVLFGMTIVVGERLDGLRTRYEDNQSETIRWRDHVQDEIDETQQRLYLHNHKGK